MGLGGGRKVWGGRMDALPRGHRTGESTKGLLENGLLQKKNRTQEQGEGGAQGGVLPIWVLLVKGLEARAMRIT